MEAKLALKNPDAMECDAVDQSIGHAEAWEDNSEACDVDAVNSKSGFFCFWCGGQGTLQQSAPHRSNQGERERWRKGRKSRKGDGNKGKGKGEWNGFCSYCGKKAHGPRDCWTKQKDEANNGKTDVGEVEEDIGRFEIGCVDKEKMYPPGLHISNRFQPLNDGDEPNLCPVEKQWTGGKITADSGAAESVWLEGLMLEIQTKPSVGSQTEVTYIAASGNRMPNLGEKKVHFKTKDGLNSSITFQVTKVKKLLAAMSKITEKGNWVCFGPSEAYIENVATGKRTNLELHNGTYSLDVEYFNEPDFTRLDRR